MTTKMVLAEVMRTSGTGYNPVVRTINLAKEFSIVAEYYFPVFFQIGHTINQHLYGRPAEWFLKV